MESAKTESPGGGLTQENDLSRFALLNPLPAVGITRESLPCRKAEAGGVLPSSAVMEQLSKGEHLSGFLIPPLSAQQRRPGMAGYGNSRICAMYMTTIERIRMSKQNRRETTRIRRIRHGIARALENLRGVRLSLVPRPGPGECLLQGMRSQAEGLSIAGKPKKARASTPQIAGKGVVGG
jgi:hypothetical protein